MNEAQLQAQVIEMCQELNLYVFHSTDARRDIGPGFPDLVIVGPNGVAFVELKSYTGRLEYRQTQWKNRLIEARAEYRLYNPSQLHDGTIRDFLVWLSEEAPVPLTIDSDANVA